MLVRALRVGERINIRSLQAHFKFKFSFREPFVVDYSRGRFFVLFRYGVVVFGGFSEGDINAFLAKISDFIVEPFDKVEEEFVDIFKKDQDRIRAQSIHLKDFDVLRVALISEVLARSMILESFEKKVEKILLDFEEVIDSFEKEGRTSLSTRILLKKVGSAMKIQHSTVSKMALLDKPDLTWESPQLDQFYNDLEDHYEIEDRYSILSEKLKILFKNVEFTLNFIDVRRSLLLEVIIVLLILIEILIFFFERFIA